MKTMTLAEWCAELERQVATIRPAVTLALHEVGDAAVEIAREKIGEYQPAIGPFREWAPLTEGTIAEKERLGFGTPDPLLRTGELRDSIGHRVEPMTLEVGSTSTVMRFQEFGTAKIPPRPVIGPAMIEAEPVAKEVLGSTLADVLAGGGGAGRIISRGR